MRRPSGGEPRGQVAMTRPLILGDPPCGAERSTPDFGRRSLMPKYLFIGSYTTEGARGVLGGRHRPTWRSRGPSWARFGGTVEGYYFACGAERRLHHRRSAGSPRRPPRLRSPSNASGAAALRTVVLLTPRGTQRRHEAKGTLPITVPLARLGRCGRGPGAHSEGRTRRMRVRPDCVAEGPAATSGRRPGQCRGWSRRAVGAAVHSIRR